jgi:hypothetical protein
MLGGEDIRDRTTVAGQPWQKRYNRMVRKDTTGQLGQDNQDRITVAGQPGKDSWDRTGTAGT